MTRYPSTTAIGLVLLAAFSMSPEATAQESNFSRSFEEDLRFQPYLNGSFGAFPSGAGGSTTYGLGFGMDFLVYDGLGLGGDIAIFGNGAFGFGVASLGPSYHFVPKSSRVVPFVKAAIGSGGEIGYGGVTFGSFGGGVNLWTLEGAAIRIEVVDRFPLEGGDHHINLQLGMTF